MIKTGALGDVVRTSFIAQALKDRYEDHNPKIFWLTEQNALPLFINNPYISKIIEIKDKEELRNISFDLIINLEESEDLCRFASSLKTKKLSGFYYKDGEIFPTPLAKEWFDMSALGKKPENDILKKKNKKTHRQIISEIIGVDYRKYEPFLRLTEKQRKLVNNFFRRHNLLRTDLIIGINTGSADRWPKHLSIEKTSKLINKLYNKFNAKIILFGGPKEIERNNEILKSSKSPVITAGCGNDLIEFPALISICSLFITTDSLGLHIALALKRKTICLIGPTSPNEIDMYNLGDKIVAESSCVCCYKKDCKSMQKIDINKIIKSVDKILNQKIVLAITAYKEPNISKAIEAALNQDTKYNYEVIVSAPDKDTINIIKSYTQKNKKIKIFKDPGKGKSYALNLLLSSINADILILTDGDVSISKNSIEEISNLFLNPEIGVVTGRPVPYESKQTKYGYWANLLFDAAHRIRKEAFEKNNFLECSAYLFAFRKNKIKKFPVDVAEDTIIPYIFWEKGYKISYAEKAEVYVKNPNNLRDWINQKTRTIKAHEKIPYYADTKTTPKVKSFKTEASGIFWVLGYPKKFKEMFWTLQLIPARFYIWIIAILSKKLAITYTDAWERIESTK
ncbi:MAG TPA: glycosyltransferase family 9 protein [Candidatus Paceibacterota bacterium]|nr:glycosyltransferase family 9 protein [Candidatus Paceibacterota bacterium]